MSATAAFLFGLFVGAWIGITLLSVIILASRSNQSNIN